MRESQLSDVPTWLSGDLRNCPHYHCRLARCALHVWTLPARPCLGCEVTLCRSPGVRGGLAVVCITGDFARVAARQLSDATSTWACETYLTATAESFLLGKPDPLATQRNPLAALPSRRRAPQRPPSLWAACGASLAVELVARCRGSLTTQRGAKALQ